MLDTKFGVFYRASWAVTFHNGTPFRHTPPSPVLKHTIFVRATYNVIPRRMGRGLDLRLYPTESIEAIGLQD